MDDVEGILIQYEARKAKRKDSPRFQTELCCFALQFRLVACLLGGRTLALLAMRQRSVYSPQLLAPGLVAVHQQLQFVYYSANQVATSSAQVGK